VIDDADGALVGNYSVTAQSGGGSSNTDEVPRTSQALVQWSTSVIINRRRLRGRTFIPGYVEAANTTGGVPLPASMSSLQTAAAALIADTGNELRVYSRAHNTSAVVQGATTWDQWATLRSRRD
jgi:phage tail tape-measure protein